MIPSSPAPPPPSENLSIQFNSSAVVYYPVPVLFAAVSPRATVLYADPIFLHFSLPTAKKHDRTPDPTATRFVKGVSQRSARSRHVASGVFSWHQLYRRHRMERASNAGQNVVLAGKIPCCCSLSLQSRHVSDVVMLARKSCRSTALTTRTSWKPIRPRRPSPVDGESCLALPCLVLFHHDCTSPLKRKLVTVFRRGAIGP